MRYMIAILASVLTVGAASAEAPNGVQEIAGQIGYKPHQMKTCAYWANEAAAAAHSRDNGVKQHVAEAAVPLGARPTDFDADLAARRTEVIAQVYENDDLQSMSPKALHDAVFGYCRSNNG
ncbi:hypothetical protein [Paraburkholderia sediminicola]|uniref:hypothetical protein n=1 Tax=Paraburkholderia sediminicola TaxID=458836 RepID=UPI0038BB2187